MRRRNRRVSEKEVIIIDQEAFDSADVGDDLELEDGTLITVTKMDKNTIVAEDDEQKEYTIEVDYEDEFFNNATDGVAEIAASLTIGDELETEFGFLVVVDMDDEGVYAEGESGEEYFIPYADLDVEIVDESASPRRRRK